MQRALQCLGGASQADQIRVTSPAGAHGGKRLVPSKTALVMIEFQNEFTQPGGQMHDAVKQVMSDTGMLRKAADVCAVARAEGCKVIMCPITFKGDGTDNPNKNLGILKGCQDGDLFKAGTWNADFDASMQPLPGDLVVEGKRGLDAFPGTNLSSLLVQNGIETVVLGGFLTNCCVESTMRTAYEKGFNTITLTDCCATTSQDGQKASTTGTFGMFSTPMSKDEFLKSL
jgi:nicotinamidase-related amidase